MIFDYSLAGLVSLGLLFYLTYACCGPSGSEPPWSRSSKSSWRLSSLGALIALIHLLLPAKKS
jgi:hypothetical protein